MEVPVIKIGNSKGIILNKTMVEKYGLGDKVEIVMKEDHIEIKPVRPPREGWGAAFKEMHELGDDDIIEEWDRENGTGAI